MEQAWVCIVKALEIDSNIMETHLWYAIILEAVGNWKSLKEKISNAYIIKEHFLKSLQLNPQSSVVLYCLGSWCFTIASISWVERKVAQTLFVDPPMATFEEALGYFRVAEEISPNFYSMNLLLIAKCYAKLKNYTKEVEYLELVAAFTPLRSEEDKAAVKEAQLLLFDR
jgi:tetratricopeptide (TPR) repeat protein